VKASFATAGDRTPLLGSIAIVGGGFAGLLAAHVLARHAARVTLFEADPLDASARLRPGTPQSQHCHLIPPGTQRLLSCWIPELESALLRRGAIPLDVGRDVHLAAPEGRLLAQTDPSSDSARPLALSRRLLDSAMRGALDRCDNITVRAETRVMNPIWRRGRVAGVRVRLARGTVTEVAADLVVDASGGNCISSTWLAPVGLPDPEISVVRPRIHVVTREFAPLEAGEPDWKLAAVLPDPGKLAQSGSASMIERRRWQVSLYGAAGDPPPAKPAAFAEYAGSLAHPLIAELLREARPLGPARSLQCSPSVWRHFEALNRYPDGLLPLGDAFCALNPVHGQGLALAVLQLRELESVLLAGAEGGAPSSAGLSRRYLTRAAAVIEPAWRWASLADLASPDAEGERPKDLAEGLDALRELRTRALCDAQLGSRLLDLFQLHRDSDGDPESGRDLAG